MKRVHTKRLEQQVRTLQRQAEGRIDSHEAARQALASAVRWIHKGSVPNSPARTRSMVEGLSIAFRGAAALPADPRSVELRDLERAFARAEEPAFFGDPIHDEPPVGWAGVREAVDRLADEHPAPERPDLGIPDTLDPRLL